MLYINFEGCSDGESIKTLLEKIRPRQLVLVHGHKESIDFLSDFCRSSGIVQGKISARQLYEVVNATTDTHIYQVKLKDSLVSRLKLMKAKEVEVAWIDSQVRLGDAKIDARSVVKMEEGEQVDDVKAEFNDVVPTLELPPTGTITVPPHAAIFVNEPKLSNFKQVLTKPEACRLSSRSVSSSSVTSSPLKKTRADASSWKAASAPSTTVYASCSTTSTPYCERPSSTQPGGQCLCGGAPSPQQRSALG